MNPRLVLREPALLIDAVETGLVLLVALGLHLGGDQQTAIVALLIALAGVAKAVTTTPWPISIFTDFARAGLVLAATFGLNWATPDKIAIVATFLGTLVTLINRAQVTPNASPVIATHGSGAGPVIGESGYTALSTIGAVLALVGIVLLLLTLLHTIHVSLLICGILIAAGVIVILVDSRGGSGARRY